MDNKLQKISEVENYLKEQTRFYINSPERLAESLIFAKKLKQFAEQVEAKVKERGSEIMFEKNLKEIDFDGWRVIKIDPTEIREYLVSSVFEAFGDVVGKALVKVDTTKLKLYLKKNIFEGEVLNKLNQGLKIKLKKGYIKIMEIKEKDDKTIYIQ
jgi:hypothetical protein